MVEVVDGMPVSCADVEYYAVGVWGDELLFGGSCVSVDTVTEELPYMEHEDVGEFMWLEE